MMVSYVEHGSNEFSVSLSFVETVLFINIHLHVLLVISEVSIVAGMEAMS
jgi:hypothetical protein